MAQPQSASSRAIGPLGTAVGAVIFIAVVVGAAGDGVQWPDVALGFVIAPGLLLGGQAVRMRTIASTLDATGPLGFLAIAAIGATFISIENTREPALLFFGASMLLAAVRGYAGCEILAISNWLLRRDDQVGCVVFSPIDAVERSISESAQPR